ncbi:MAG: hypothetical protein IIW92_05440, partial [Lachnospiraceae bacterium]|nr:hypothetical protein [Lachnospiraceae bacterium]
MRRSIKKAVAFTLAAVTMFANLSITSPVKAAEYGEVKEVLPIKYDDCRYFNEGYVFVDYIEADYGKKTGEFIDELVIVDSKGEKTTLNVKRSDNTNKYRRISIMNEECMCIINDDYRPTLYYADGTWIGNGKVQYDDMYPLGDGNILVVDKDGCHVINKKEEYVKKNLLSNKNHIYMSVETFDEYLIVGEYYFSGDEQKFERKIFDKNYKEVTGFDLKKYGVYAVCDKYLVLSNGKEIHFYDTNLKKCNYTFKQNIVTNPSVSAGDGKVLVDYYAYVGSFWSDKTSKEYIYINVDNNYSDAFGNPSGDQRRIYLDKETLEEVSANDVVGPIDVIPYKVVNTDIKVETKDGDIELYYGDKKVTDRLSINIFIKKNLEDIIGLAVDYSSASGYNGDLYIPIYVGYKNDSTDEVTLVLEKKAGYSLDKAKVIKKQMANCEYDLGGVIRFVDGTFLFNGKEYDENTKIEIIENYYAKTEEENLATMHYVLKVNDGKKVTYTLFDKNHTQVYQSSDMIVNMLPKGVILVAKDVEVEGQSYTDSIYGCRYATKTLVSSQDILDELTQVEEGETVEVEIKKNDPIKAEVFEVIKGKDVNVVLNLDNGMSWKINGKNVKGDKLTDINLTVDVVKDVVPAKAIDKVNLKGERIELSLAHTGEFGFSAELTMNVKKENAGKFANRFYYNPETKELEFQ